MWRRARLRGSTGAPHAQGASGSSRDASGGCHCFLISAPHMHSNDTQHVSAPHPCVLVCRRSPGRRNSLVALMRGIAPRPETDPTATRVEAPAAPKVEAPRISRNSLARSDSTALRRDSTGRIDGQALLATVGAVFSKPAPKGPGSKLGSCKSLLASAMNAGMSVRAPSQRGE